MKNERRTAEDYFREIDRMIEIPEKPVRPEVADVAATAYGHAMSRHPERIMMKFSDGSEAEYSLVPDMPAPQIIENIRIIRKWRTGYQAPKERRRRR